MLVIHQGGLYSGWSFIRVVFTHADHSSGWSLLRLVINQGGL